MDKIREDEKILVECFVCRCEMVGIWIVDLNKYDFKSAEFFMIVQERMRGLGWYVDEEIQHRYYCDKQFCLQRYAVDIKKNIQDRLEINNEGIVTVPITN